MLEYKVKDLDSGQKLLFFLVNQLKGKYTARFIKKVIDKNGCEINGRCERFASTLVGRGDCVRLNLDHIPVKLPRAFEKHRILFEDDSLLIYNKPAGINCDKQGILSLFKDVYPDLQLVHRLDSQTTGVLIFAKNESAYQAVLLQFKAHKVKKRYLTVVDGAVNKSDGIIENFLCKKQDYAGQALWASIKNSKGLYANTSWKKLKTTSSASLLACYPKTGRTHQIRVHMAEMNHPILGDVQYQQQKPLQCSYKPSRYLLHAEEVVFQHPFKDELLLIKAPLPEDFNQALAVIFEGK